MHYRQESHKYLFAIKQALESHIICIYSQTFSIYLRLISKNIFPLLDMANKMIQHRSF